MTEHDTTLPATGVDAGDQISPLQRERDEVYDRLLRMSAEFDNYRKRTERERRQSNGVYGNRPA